MKKHNTPADERQCFIRKLNREMRRFGPGDPVGIEISSLIEWAYARAKRAAARPGGIGRKAKKKPNRWSLDPVRMAPTRKKK